MTCDSTFACISWQNTHLNFTDFARSWVFTTVVAIAVCLHWCTWCLMRSDIQCSLGSNAGCLVSQDTKALSAQPPTWKMPSESIFLTLLSWDSLLGLSVSLWSNDSLCFPTLLGTGALLSASYYFSLVLCSCGSLCTNSKLLLCKLSLWLIFTSLRTRYNQ